MSKVHPAWLLTQAQRDQVVGWLTAGISDYPAIKQLLIKHGIPVFSRQNLDYLRRKYGKNNPRCAACGRAFEPGQP